MKYVTLGYIIDSFKLDGTFKVVSSTDFASLRYKKGNIIYLNKRGSDNFIPLTISNYHNNGKLDFVKTIEIDTKEKAEEYIGYEILFDEEKAIIPEGFYRYSSLINLEVYNEVNEKMGVVISVMEYPAQVTLIVKGNSDKTFQIPFVEFFIKDVVIDDNKIIVHEIEGMR